MGFYDTIHFPGSEEGAQVKIWDSSLNDFLIGDKMEPIDGYTSYCIDVSQHYTGLGIAIVEDGIYRSWNGDVNARPDLPKFTGYGERMPDVPPVRHVTDYDYVALGQSVQIPVWYDGAVSCVPGQSVDSIEGELNYVIDMTDRTNGTIIVLNGTYIAWVPVAVHEYMSLPCFTRKGKRVFKDAARGKRV